MGMGKVNPRDFSKKIIRIYLLDVGNERGKDEGF